MKNKKGSLIIISGPAGSGKGTISKKLISESDNFDVSLSTTSRLPRGDDIPGVTYNFVTREKFLEMITNGELAEYAEYVGNYYGTPIKTIESMLQTGKNLILEIETHGALQIKAKFPDALMIWLCPPDLKTLEKRLRNRGTNSEEDINKRLSFALCELQLVDYYDYIVINREGESDTAVNQIKQIVEAHKFSVKNNKSFFFDFFKSQ